MLKVTDMNGLCTLLNMAWQLPAALCLQKGPNLGDKVKYQSQILYRAQNHIKARGCGVMLPQKLLYYTVSQVGSEALLILTAGLYTVCV